MVGTGGIGGIGGRKRYCPSDLPLRSIPPRLRRGASRLRPRVARVLRTISLSTMPPCKKRRAGPNPSPSQGRWRDLWHSMQNRGQVERPLRGLCGMSACSSWGEKPQRAAAIPSGTPSERVALLYEYYEGHFGSPSPPRRATIPACHSQSQLTPASHGQFFVDFEKNT